MQRVQRTSSPSARWKPSPAGRSSSPSSAFALDERLTEEARDLLPRERSRGLEGRGGEGDEVERRRRRRTPRQGRDGAQARDQGAGDRGVGLVGRSLGLRGHQS